MRIRSLIRSCVGVGALAVASAMAQAPADRGALLYQNHCKECHDEQMHWRNFNRVRDWDSLNDEVRRWQGTARLNWTDDDIRAVARHLNDTIYQFPRAEARR